MTRMKLTMFSCMEQGDNVSPLWADGGDSCMAACMGSMPPTARVKGVERAHFTLCGRLPEDQALALFLLEEAALAREDL